jgi:signal transduction histidine kinase
MSERRAADGERVASDGTVSAAFDALPAQVAVVDADGVILETNRAWRAFGEDNDLQGPVDSVGENYLGLCEGADDETATAAAAGIRSVLAGAREEYALEYPCHSPDERRWFLLRVRPLAGDEPRALVMHVDVTERREAELRVEARNETLSTVANVLSHDLRNPLNVALGRTDVLSRNPDIGPENVAEQAGKITDSLERITDIVEDALVLAGETDRVDIDRVSLETVARDAWSHVETGDATLHVDADATLLADASLLTQLFENLFRNATEHAGEAPTVTVGVTPGGFTVADDGPGVPDEARESVFEVGVSTAGTGMGLAIVRKIAAAHGWDVALADPGESDGPSGARFAVSGVALED